MFSKEKLLEIESWVGMVENYEGFYELQQQKKRLPTTSNHYEFLYFLSFHYELSTIVEIGTHKGLSALCLYNGNRNAKIYTIDISPEAGELIPSGINAYVGDSIELANSMPNNIELLYIDGGHTYEQFKKDYETYLPKMGKGGLILIDDINTLEVGRFWKEIEEDKIEFKTIHQPYGFGGILL